MLFRRVMPVVGLAVALVAAPVAAATRQVDVQGLAFKPATRTAALGDTVRWTNQDGFAHTATRTGPGGWSLSLPAGASRTRIFRAAGSFAYLCTVPGHVMSGTVRVPVKASPASGTSATTFTIRVATVNAPAGTVHVIQRKAPGGSFTAWKTISGQTTTFKSATKGTWQFRAAVRDTGSGATSGYSPAVSITIG